MKGSYIKKISILLTIIFLSSYVIASSFVQLDTKEFKDIPYFNLNNISIISQNGESIGKIDDSIKALVNLTVEDKHHLDLVNNYYQIQDVLLIKDLHIVKVEYKKFGQIKIYTVNHQFIKFQDFQLAGQLETLKLFFQSEKSKNLLKDFKTIDLRHKNKLAIGYF
tara:strand:- start:137 stop:631 length:495 start_codon:yes stop_codon:yes gene_type:complete